jgi:predicted RNA polymerase sigma factor
VLACLIGYFGDFDLAEEAAAEAFAVVAQRWPSDGMPGNPGAWLVTTARHRAIDRLRRDRVLAAKLRLLAPGQAEQAWPAGPAGQTGEDDVAETAIPDERLELVFMCCHPALATEAQVALTLRAVGGLATEEIAPEVLGLLALMLLHDARRAARFAGQDLVLLPDQDRSLWDWQQIAEARACPATSTGIPPGPNCSAGSAAPVRPGPPTARRSPWRARSPNAASSNGVSPNPDPAAVPSPAARSSCR